jgi:hypothetical protein
LFEGTTLAVGARGNYCLRLYTGYAVLALHAKYPDGGNQTATRSTMARFIAQRVASTALANSTRAPSPVVDDTAAVFGDFWDQ